MAAVIADDVGPLLADGQHLVARRPRSRRAAPRQRHAGLGVDDTDRVEVVGLVVLRGRVAAALLA